MSEAARTYYNEIDPQKAAWLRELMRANAISEGDIDERSVADVRASDLRGYTRCHFFAGIGVWDYALRLAGWPDDEEVWTGSCPCPSFSVAGKGEGFDDPRHLWPAWWRLIRECRPARCFGEQVDGAIGYGWFDLVATDLEKEGYAVGAAVLGACSVGAPIRRQRLWFVASSGVSLLGSASGTGLPGRSSERGHDGEERAAAERTGGATGGVGGAESGRCGVSGNASRPWGGGHADSAGSTGDRPGPVNGFWRDADWLRCRDGKWRPVRPSTFPLAHGAPARVVRLRGYGDAIVPQGAAAFIEAYRAAR